MDLKNVQTGDIVRNDEPIKMRIIKLRTAKGMRRILMKFYKKQ